MKGMSPATINGAGFICFSYSVTGQDSFIIFWYPLCKGITAMLCRSKPVAKFLLGARIFFLCIIVVNRVQEVVMHKLTDIRGSVKVNFIIRAFSVGRFGQIVRYTNPRIKIIHPHISGSTGLVNDGVSSVLLELDLPFVGVLLWVMRLSSSGGYVVLVHNL